MWIGQLLCATSPSGAGAPHAGHSRHQRPSFLRRFLSAKPSSQFLLLAQAYQKLLSAHVTTAVAEGNYRRGHAHTALRNQMSKETAESWCTPRSTCLQAGIVRQHFSRGRLD
eukprot:1157234-Pelagomonas_calceolata.AAC.3